MTTIAITGVSGFVGRRLATALDRRSDVTRIVGLDLRAPEGLTSSKLVYRHLDVCGSDVEAALEGVDVVVHLAAQLDPIHDEAAMRAINVEGTRNVVEAAERAGVRHLVYPSSATAYGAAPDNDVPLTEDSPIRGTPGFNYSEHKREVEHWLARWLTTPRQLAVAILRPAVILGPGLDNHVGRILEQPRPITVRGHEPPLQFVHIDDVVSAIEHVIDQRLTGAYNVCAEGWLSFAEVVDLLGRRPLPLPEELAFTSTERLWELGIGEAPPGLLKHLMYPWVMSPSKLMATGWRPRITNRAAVAETVAQHQEHVAVLGVRARRSTVRWTAFAGAAVAGLVVAVTLRAWRRSRTRRRARRGEVVVGS